VSDETDGTAEVPADPAVWVPTGIAEYDAQPEEERVITEPVSYDPDDPNDPNHPDAQASTRKTTGKAKG
jgi:hypothetical protein